MLIQSQLEQFLQSLQPHYLEIINESAGHGGYFEGKESHFKVTLVSDVFAGLRLVQRHQKVYAAVADVLNPKKIHALAIHAYTPEEWTGERPDSPLCAHAAKNS
ncbi:MAG: BolA family transcriptional regulator [Acinetobacter sp.]|jgi:BolA protein|nr:MAG: BolA family transcriptional regulator [Acinetobacter sp.]